MNVQELLDMEMHSKKKVNGGYLRVTRVPGGWLYASWTTTTKRSTHGERNVWHYEDTTFVPEPVNVELDNKGN